jgi:N-acetylmuramoyl-L-alanine amidase
MNIKNDKLEGATDLPSPNIGGTLTKPTIIVLHYTASGPGNDAKYFQNVSAKVSAHTVVERDGKTSQSVAFNKKAWHAGKSVWRDKSNANDFSIGIEIDNWGLLEKRADGNYYSHAGTKIEPSGVFVAPNKLGNGKYWEVYSQAQKDAVYAQCEALVRAYPSIKEVVGHEDIAPRRKIDPGPALYDFITYCNNNLFNGGRAGGPPAKDVRKITASNLSVRNDDRLDATRIGSLSKGETVNVLYDAGDWSLIEYNGGEAWVFDKYLTK